VGHSLAHSGNVPVIYNPKTMHISSKFHVVFDDQFTTLTANPATCSKIFYESLYNTALWLHKDTFADAADLHHFESHWSDPPLTTTKHRSMQQSCATKPNLFNPAPSRRPCRIPSRRPCQASRRQPPCRISNLQPCQAEETSNTVCFTVNLSNH
jgi:hypothetical protein